ncbi:MAG: DUF1669 domain-containing protein [Anaerolineaceae bacterium]|nr:DUF1669 domain-containing protein [Anaerolineaceae bacterium]
MKLKKQIHALIMIFSAITLSGCDLGLLIQETQETPVLESDSDQNIKIYFTNPSTNQNELESELIRDIEEAEFHIDVAMYNLSLENIANALIQAHQNGIRVRIVTDSNALDHQQFKRLSASGIPIVGDQRERSMHNKFLIIDDHEVWTGSLNLTWTGMYEDHNHMINIRSSKLAENYISEFEEMFIEGFFGPGGPANIPHPHISLDNIVVETYFSPENHPGVQIERLIMEAEESIHFMAFSFTADNLSEALVSQHQQGIHIQGIMDQQQAASNTGGEYQNFLDAGLDVNLDKNPGQMHHKVMVIDGWIVILGSYNFSRSAEEFNDENLLILFSSEIAEKYLEEFSRIPQ